MEALTKENKAENVVQSPEKVVPCNIENSPGYLFDLVKLILANELVAKFRFDGDGIKVTFLSGNNLD